MCYECPAKYECLNSPAYPVPCRQGYYCLRGNDPNSNNGLPKECPEGTFGAKELLSTESECTQCLPGRYCETKGLTNVTGLCAAGYWCKVSAKTRNPTNVAKKHGKCPTGGVYCPEGTEEPINCPVGRYALPGRDGLQSADQCNKCPGGKYCALGKQTAPTGDCAEGYYCISASPTNEPNSTYGGICPPGTYCPSGSSNPTPCKAGTYNDLPKQASCKLCPPGFYCLSNSTSPEPCPAGYWCENGTVTELQNACPPGTFNNLLQRSSRSNCIDCTPGSYCDKSGKFLFRKVCSQIKCYLIGRNLALIRVLRTNLTSFCNRMM